MSLLLPSRPNLRYLKHHAKNLLAAHRRGESAACSVLRHLRRFQGWTETAIRTASVQLSDIHYALALAYGFKSWNALVAYIASSPQSAPDANEPSLVDSASLAATVDALSDAFFHTRVLSVAQRRAAASWIASRQGLPGSYAGAFAATAKDAREGYRLFTGERVSPGPGAAHIISQEACRALRLLDVRDPQVQTALAQGSRGLLAPLCDSVKRPVRQSASGMRLLPGMVCCMKCSCALYRHLVCCADEHADFLALGVKAIHAHRNGTDGWRGWPFHYTLLTLLEIGTPPATEELSFAAPRCKTELAKRPSKSNIYSQRRRLLMERVLARCVSGTPTSAPAEIHGHKKNQRKTS